jgi:hypothetical protein
MLKQSLHILTTVLKGVKEVGNLLHKISCYEITVTSVKLLVTRPFYMIQLKNYTQNMHNAIS